MDFYGNMTGWMWVAFMGLFWVALIALGAWAVLRFTDRPTGGGRRILEERFARGEIDVDEFERRREAIGR